MKKALAAFRRGLFRAVMFLLLAVSLSCGSMLISYAAVRFVTRDPEPAKPLDPEQLHRARMLRTFANELVGLCNRYAVRVPAEGAPITAVNRQWIEDRFRPDLRYLAQRMDDTILGDLPEYSVLKSAASRCAAMARYPGDSRLRMEALRDVHEAVDSIEAYIERLGQGVYGAPPRRIPRFGLGADDGGAR